MGVNATIITIGDEILIGQIIDTNSAFIAKHLNKIGIKIQEILSIQDDVDNIVESFERSLDKSQILIITGGLGPTKDDKTKTALCKFLNCELVKEEKILENIIQLLKERGYNREINSLNQEQALIPEKSKFIQNRYGTAPCLWTSFQNKVIINLPGVPYEMKGIMRDEILPRLKTEFKTESIIHRDILISGIPESNLAILLEDWENNLPKFINLSYLPNRTSIDLRFSAYGINKDFAELEIQNQIDLLKQIAGEYIIAEFSGSPNVVLGDILRKKKLTISIAESCTGGSIANLITSLSGASNYFIGGVVAYSSEIKKSVLNVKQQTIDDYTVVSQHVAEEMAIGIKKLFNTNISISTTGVAGPNKGEDGKEVGSVWVTVAYEDFVESKFYNYPYLDREDFIKTVTNNALNLLIQILTKNI